VNDASEGAEALAVAHPRRGRLPLPQAEAGREEADRNLALELVRVTEAAALAASHWMGLGKKNEADGAAVSCTRLTSTCRRSRWEPGFPLE